MTGILDSILAFITEARDLAWGLPMIVLLVGTGVLLTLATRGLQVRRLGESLRLIFSRSSRSTERGKGDISPFAALMTALAATVGNGNIAGVATAIATGGPGAPFWMWVAGFFGMATKYAEGFLGVRFRRIAEDGSVIGGPMYYARDAVKWPKVGAFLGGFFAVGGAVAALLGTGNMAQSNSMALAFHTEFDVPFLASAVFLTVAVGLVIIGGIKRIGSVSERLVPAMILFYFGGAMVILVAYAAEIPAAFALIFESAFGIRPVAGALVGTTVQRAISLGVSRGVLSNESGLGSAAIAQAASTSTDPARNGLLAMTGTFIDTIIVNTLTTLTIVVTGAYQLTYAWRGDAADNLTSTALTAHAFETVIPHGGVVIAVASFLFGYSTLIAWCYYGEVCVRYLWGTRITMPYRYAFLALLFVGALLQGKYLEIVWAVGDTFNALMALPNLIGLLLLVGYVARFSNDYFKDRDGTLRRLDAGHYELRERR
jgi:AGCS family alanine or glycine:cation symporter